MAEPKRKRADRAAYRLVVRAEPNVDEIRALRHLLKVMLRQFGIRCLSIAPELRTP